MIVCQTMAAQNFAAFVEVLHIAEQMICTLAVESWTNLFLLLQWNCPCQNVVSCTRYEKKDYSDFLFLSKMFELQQKNVFDSNSFVIKFELFMQTFN